MDLKELTEGLTAALKSAGFRPAKEKDWDEYDQGKGSVPASEMARSSKARKAAEERADVAEAALAKFAKGFEDYQATSQADFEKRLKETVATEVTSVREGFDRQTILGKAGIDDKGGQRAALAAYNEIPEAGRPDLGKQLEAWKAKPEDAPKVLGVYFTDPDTKGGNIPNTGRNTGGGTGSKAIDKMSAEELDAAILAMEG